MKLKIKNDKTPSMGGAGIYWSKSTWNLRNDNKFYGPSIVFHLFNRALRFYWVTSA